MSEQLEARIFDDATGTIDGAAVTVQRAEDIYAAIMRHARQRAAQSPNGVLLAAHDLPRGQRRRFHISCDGAVAEADTPAAVASPNPVPVAAQPTQVPPPPALAHADPGTLHNFVRPTKPIAAAGWRKALRLGPSPAEARIHKLIEAAQTRATRPEVCAMICLKGGIGKTSTTAGVGLTLARHRGDRIIAIDANPDAGDLYERTCPGAPPATLTDLAARSGDIESMTDLARYTGLAERLAVIAGDQEPRISESLSAEDFTTALRVVKHYYNVMMVDCGTGVTHPSMVGILGAAGHVIIAGGYAVSGARRAENTLRWLHASGYEHLARNSTVVLTQTASVSNTVDKAAIEATLAELAATVITVPHDQAVADGTAISLDQLHDATADAYLRVAASVAANFR